MSLPTLFELCVPREDVVRGSIAESDFAADLAQVLRGDAPVSYTHLPDSHAQKRKANPSDGPPHFHRINKGSCARKSKTENPSQPSHDNSAPAGRPSCALGITPDPYVCLLYTSRCV